MTKVVIENNAESYWADRIEERLNLLLASTVSRLTRVNVVLEKREAQSPDEFNYHCEVSGISGNTMKYVSSNENPNADEAIEGAFHRLKRSIVRKKQFL